MVLTIIAGALKCVGAPLAILCLLSLRKEKKRVSDKVVCFSIIFLGLIWRMFYFVYAPFSSRYCSVFIPFAIVLAVISLAKTEKRLSGILVTIITTYQLYDTYNDYNKKYILDAGEYLHILAKNDSAYIMIQEKEYSRINDLLGNYETEKIDIGSEKDFNRVFDFYDIRGERKVYVATYDKRAKEQLTDPRIKIVFKSKSGQRRRNYFTIFSVATPEGEDPSHSREAVNNQLINGNLEEIEETALSKGKLKKWINAGCYYYDSESLILPKHEYLLPYWSAPQNDNYPKVCLSSEHPIEGSHSLFVELQDNNVVYLLNKIERKRGCLSFKIQSIDNKTHLHVSEYTYTHDSETPNKYHIKDLILFDNNVHQVSIIVPERAPDEQQSLFFISGSNTLFMMDDLSYYYLPNE